MKRGSNLKVLRMLDNKRAQGAYGYDEVMELLCRLPMFPSFVRMKSLAKDMGYRSLVGFSRVVDSAQSRYGSSVRSFNRNGRCMCLYPPDGRRVQRQMEAYWDRIHGSGYQASEKPIWREP